MPEIGVDRLKGFNKALARLDVDLLDRLLRIANGVQQILPLRIEEVVTLLRLLKLFERLRIHRAHRLNAAPYLLILLLGFQQLHLVRLNLHRGSELLNRSAQLLARRLLEELQLAALPHQLHFNLLTLLLRFSRRGSQTLQSLAQLVEVRALRGLQLMQLCYVDFQLRNPLMEAGGMVVEFNVIGQQTRPIDAQPFQLSGQPMLPAREFAQLLIEASLGKVGGALPLFERRQLGPQSRVLFIGALQLSLQTGELFAGPRQRLLQLPALRFLRLQLLFERRLLRRRPLPVAR